MEEERKVCPLLSIAKNSEVFCLEEECAWWDNLDRTCVLQVIADKIWGIYDEIHEHP